MNTILTAENINFGYHADKLILKDFNLAINPGAMTGLIGPNGAGKSTALKILSGYLNPCSGKVHLQANDIARIVGGINPRYPGGSVQPDRGL